MKRRTIIVGLALAVAAGLAAIPVASASPSYTLPKTITATKLAPDSSPFLRVGTVIPTSYLRWAAVSGASAQRVFVNQSDGLSVATDKPGATYPACTTNSGKTWKICGPHVHVAAANAPDVVTAMGAYGSTYFVYGGPEGFGSVVVSGNAGKSWYRAYMPYGSAYAVVASPGRLAVFCWTGSSWITYTSKNGQKWTLTKTLL